MQSRCTCTVAAPCRPHRLILGWLFFFGLLGCSITCHYSINVAGVIVGLARDRSCELGVSFVFKQMDVSLILVVFLVQKTCTADHRPDFCFLLFRSHLDSVVYPRSSPREPARLTTAGRPRSRQKTPCGFPLLAKTYLGHG
jgi:hypothetical protein